MSFYRFAYALPLLAAGCLNGEPAPAATTTQHPMIGGLTDTYRDYVVGVGNQDRAWCTATVISRRTVLTAAHCALGITRVYFGPSLGSGGMATATNERAHPGWDSVGWDVAVVQLLQDAPVQPVPLLRETMVDSPRFVGPHFTWVGYGANNAEPESGFGLRRVARFPLVAVGPANIGGEMLDESVMLYHGDTPHPCFGDSGGPTFFVDERVERQAGVASWVEFEDCTGYGAHSRADQLMIDNWIQAQIDEFEGDDPCRSNGVCDESCNVGNLLVDPDCAQNHCDADGMCVLSCVMPVDPDCSTTADLCILDGVCDPSCTPEDPDCAEPADAGPIQTADAGVEPPDAAPSLPDSGVSPQADAGPMPQPDAGVQEPPGDEAGCGCRTSRTSGTTGMLGLLLCGLLLRKRRR